MVADDGLSQDQVRAFMAGLWFGPAPTSEEEAALLALLPASRAGRWGRWWQWVGWEMLHALIDLSFYLTVYSRTVDDDGRRRWRGGQWHWRGAAWTTAHCTAVEAAWVRAHPRRALAIARAGGEAVPRDPNR